MLTRRTPPQATHQKMGPLFTVQCFLCGVASRVCPPRWLPLALIPLPLLASVCEGPGRRLLAVAC